MQRFYRYAALSAFFLFLFGASFLSASAQDLKTGPERSVVGIELGNRDSAKKYLLPGHVPRVDDEGRTSYFFYNEWGTQVMRLTVPSAEDPYFVTEIEVVAVGKSYRKRHYQDKENGLMMTENGIFIGFRQTAMNLFVGVRNLGKANTIGPGEVVKIKGEPDSRTKSDENVELLTYSLPGVMFENADFTADYYAEYEFSKNKLRRFLIRIDPVEPSAK